MIIIMKRKSKKRRTRVRGKENKRNTKRNTKRNKRGGMRRQSDYPDELTRRVTMRQEFDQRLRGLELDEETIMDRCREAVRHDNYDELIAVALRGTQKRCEKIRLKIDIAKNETQIIFLSRGGTSVDEAAGLIGDGSLIPEWDWDADEL